MGLKDVLYDEPYENPCQQVDYQGFALAGETRVEESITVEGQAIGDLFAMPPYYWKTPSEGSARLARLERLEGRDYVVFPFRSGGCPRGEEL